MKPPHPPPQPQTSIQHYRDLVSHGWEPSDAAEAVIGPLAIAVERLRAKVERERDPMVLTGAQRRTLRALNRSDILRVQGDTAGALQARAERGSIKIWRALLRKGLITGRPWPEPALTPAGWAWIERHDGTGPSPAEPEPEDGRPDCESCGGPCRGSGAV